MRAEEPRDQTTDQALDEQSAGQPGEDARAELDAVGVVFWGDVWPFSDDSAEASGVEEQEQRLVAEPVHVSEPEPAPARAQPMVDTPGPLPRPVLIPSRPQTRNQTQPRTTAEVPLPATWRERDAPWSYAGWDAKPRIGSKVLLAAMVVAALALVAIVWVWAWDGHQTDAGPGATRSAAYDMPAGLRPGTERVRTRVLPSGDLQVTHWIRATRTVSAVTVRTPAADGLPRGSVATIHLVIAVDGTPYPVTGAAAQYLGARTIQVPAGRSIFVRYRLTGAVQRTGPGDRALARITSLDVTPDNASLRITRTVVGATVLALACASGPPGAPAVPCGGPVHGVWTVGFAADHQHSRVMAQLNL